MLSEWWSGLEAGLGETKDDVSPPPSTQTAEPDCGSSWWTYGCEETNNFDSTNSELSEWWAPSSVWWQFSISLLSEARSRLNWKQFVGIWWAYFVIKFSYIASLLSGFNELIKVIVHHMIQWPLIGETGLIRPNHFFSYSSKFFFGYIPSLFKKFCICRTSKAILLWDKQVLPCYKNKSKCTSSQQRLNDSTHHCSEFHFLCLPSIFLCCLHFYNWDRGCRICKDIETLKSKTVHHQTPYFKLYGAKV